MDETFRQAKQIIEKASPLVLKNLNKIKKISYKKGAFNLVTNVDKEVDKFLIKEIKSRYKDHSIIAEESGKHKKNKRFIWFIDPIDGTTNFAHGYPCFCISIGFSKDGVIQFGLVKNPLTNELYSAKKNKGAWLNGKRIYVSRNKKLNDSLLATGFPHHTGPLRTKNFEYFKKITLITHGVRRDGAAALDLCYVASGKLDAFWETKLNPWDIAAGMLILKEAGGKVKNFKGIDLNVFERNIVATNGFIPEELLNHLS